MGNLLAKLPRSNVHTLLVFFLFLLFLLIPDNSYAMEPVYQVLSNTNTGEGKAVKQVWDALMNFTNGIIVLLLIAIAIAQILRININTYGVKKVLPALVLAIIAANFSFLFCRLLIDFANVIMVQFSPSSGDLSGYKEAFRIDPKYTTAPTGAEVFWFILSQFLLIAGAIVIYILAFLFLIRNWIIYFLVGLAPLAMMSMVLPQTKSLFNQWWSNFAKWTFMPVVSVFWIWVGVQWYNSGFNSGVYLINFIFAGVCFYLAITTPFKMGGAVMQGWGKVGKWGLDRTGLPGAYKYFQDKGKATWDARKQSLYNTAKESRLNVLKVGTGLDVAQQKLADAKKRQAATQSEAKGNYIERAGNRRARWLIKTQSKEGSEEFAEKMALQNLVKEPNSKDYKFANELRFNRAKALAALEGAEKTWEAFDAAMKRNYFNARDLQNKELVGPELTKRKEELKEIADSVLDGEIRGNEATKAHDDRVNESVMERKAIDNIAADKDMFDEKKEGSIVQLMQEFKNLVNSGVTSGDQYNKLKKRLEAENYDTSDVGQLEIDVMKDKSIADKKFQDKLLRLTQTYGDSVNQIPVSLRHLLTYDENGKVTGLKQMEGIEKSRMSIKLGQAIDSGGQGMAMNYSAAEIAHSITTGNPAEKIDEKTIARLWSGQKEITEQVEMDRVNKFMQMMQAAEKALASRSGMRPTADAEIMARTILENLKTYDNQKGLAEIANGINQQFSAASGKPGSIIIETKGKTTAQLHDALTEFYEGKNSIASAKGAPVSFNNEAKAKSQLITSMRGSEAALMKGYSANYIK